MPTQDVLDYINKEIERLERAKETLVGAISNQPQQVIPQTQYAPVTAKRRGRPPLHATNGSAPMPLNMPEQQAAAPATKRMVNRSARKAIAAGTAAQWADVRRLEALGEDVHNLAQRTAYYRQQGAAGQKSPGVTKKVTKRAARKR